MPTALTAAYQNELKRTRAAVSGQLRKYWNSLPDYRDASVPLFLGHAIPTVEAGQKRAVALTNAYLSRQIGVSPQALNVDALVGANTRNGVSLADVYARPFTSVWTSIAVIGFSAAVIKGLNRLESMGSMDVALAARDTASAWAKQAGGVVGFQRVADPSCCDFCQSIDGAKVFADDPAPLHNNCGCTVEPLTEADTGGDTSDFVSFSSGETFGDARIEDHGEMGPVITDKADNFTGPNDLA